MSTVKVYGEFTYKIPWTETTPCQPLTLYGKSKLEGEQRIKELEDGNFVISIIRTPLVIINNKRSMTYVANLVSLIDSVIKQRKFGIFLASDGDPISTTQLATEIAKHFQK